MPRMGFVQSFLKGTDVGFKLREARNTAEDRQREKDVREAVSGAITGVPIIPEEDTSQGAVVANQPKPQPILMSANSGVPQETTAPPTSGERKRAVPTSVNYQNYLQDAERRIAAAGGSLEDIEKFREAFTNRRREGLVNNIAAAATALEAGDLQTAKQRLQTGYGFLMNGRHMKVQEVNGKLVVTTFDEETGKPTAGLTLDPNNKEHIDFLLKQAQQFQDPAAFSAAELTHRRTRERQKEEDILAERDVATKEERNRILREGIEVDREALDVQRKRYGLELRKDLRTNINKHTKDIMTQLAESDLDVVIADIKDIPKEQQKDFTIQLERLMKNPARLATDVELEAERIADLYPTANARELVQLALANVVTGRTVYDLGEPEKAVATGETSPKDQRGATKKYLDRAGYVFSDLFNAVFGGDEEAEEEVEEETGAVPAGASRRARREARKTGTGQTGIEKIKEASRTPGFFNLPK